ncbi:MAG TPA: choice-of-anchor tandem repeat GloVer-containing protein [Steroidobacteraceae bacterium]|nr:choice-of-anchor tandem repeat GloVer-containing protein [Steroidobacteraceae bacterium]
MLQFAHPRSSMGVVTNAVVLCVLAALSGCRGSSSNISHSESARTYSLGTSISGLDAPGLVLMVHSGPQSSGADFFHTINEFNFPVRLQMVDSAAVSVAAGETSQGLASSLPSGARYSVTVGTQPTGETCTVASGTGTIQSANVANVVVTCSNHAYSVSGSISGLNGSGLVLANGADTLAVNSGATSFTMPTPVAYTSSYVVAVQTQPAGLACAVGNGTGTMPAAAMTNVTISCTDQPFSIGGTISGLGNNAGLTLTNGIDTLSVAAGSTSFMMPTPVPFGSAYSVAVQAAPSGLTCSAGNASGTVPAGNVASVVISCSDQSYTVGGTISGLAGGGMVLANGSDTLAVNSGASSFTMPGAVAYTSAYVLTVKTQPTGLSCSVSNGAGTMGSAAITNIAVTCSANTYTLGGIISGLTASGLVLLDKGGDATALSAHATQFSMNTGVAYGAAYAITVQTPPAGLVCSVSNGTGTMSAADVSSVSIACVSNFGLLYSFAGGSADAADPYHTLIQGSDGDFYGTTLAGGTSNLGTIFKVTPSGTESVFYSFTTVPYSGLVQSSDGNIYGTTASGGTSGRGTVFKITPSGMQSVLYSFPAGSSDPYTGLIQGSDGNFYGTTGAGGTNDDGTVFKITPSGTETVLHVFPKTGSDGETPYAGVIQGSDSNLYGTTYFGGANGLGTVFKVTPGGTETVLYSFAAGNDGEHPYADVTQGSDGSFYGTTYQGGTSGLGTVFKITLSGTETVLYSFAGGSDGANPEAGLIQGSDGNFYGTTFQGGAGGLGTVFKITPSGTETVLHAFAGSSDGANPSANLVQGSDGTLYGSTGAGGTKGFGTFFKVALQ